MPDRSTRTPLAGWLRGWQAEEDVEPPPLRWWESAWRYAVAAGISLIALLSAYLPGAPWAVSVRPSWFAILDLVLGVGAFVLVSRRRRWPMGVGLTLAVVSGFAVSASGPTLLALASVAARRRLRDTAILIVLNTGVSVASEQGPWAPTEARNLTQTLTVGVATFVVVAAIGYAVGSRAALVQSLRERADAAEREQQARMAQARTAERTRIAREMHDVLAHRISLVAMHASALTYRPDLTDEERTTAAETIETNAHLALAELRDILGVLRDPPPGARASGPGGTAAEPGSTQPAMVPEEPGAGLPEGQDAPLPEGPGAGLPEGPGAGLPEPPQPGLDDLSGLIAETRSLGVRVECSVAVESTEVPATLGRTAFRVVQEGLTNARKHAPAASVTVGVSGCPGADLVVVVANPKPVGPTRRAVPGAGLGLLGLRERVEQLGGRLSAGHVEPDDGSTADGGRTVGGGAAQVWRLEARLPWPAP